MSELDRKMKRIERKIYPVIVLLWWVAWLLVAYGLFQIGVIIYYGSDFIVRNTGATEADLRGVGFGTLAMILVLIFSRVAFIQPIKKEIREERARDKDA